MATSQILTYLAGTYITALSHFCWQPFSPLLTEAAQPVFKDPNRDNTFGYLAYKPGSARRSKCIDDSLRELDAARRKARARECNFLVLGDDEACEPVKHFLRARSRAQAAVRFEHFSNLDRRGMVNEVASIEANGLVYRFYDFLNRTERRKWIHQFEGGAMNVLFVVDLAGYAVLAQDEQPFSVLPLEAARLSFDSVMRSRWFTRSRVVLLMVNAHVMRERLPESPLGVLYPEYRGGDGFDAAIKYLQTKITTSRWLYGGTVLHCVVDEVNDASLEGVLTKLGETNLATYLGCGMS